MGCGVRFGHRAFASSAVAMDESWRWNVSMKIVIPEQSTWETEKFWKPPARSSTGKQRIRWKMLIKQTKIATNQARHTPPCTPCTPEKTRSSRIHFSGHSSRVKAG